MSKGKYYKILNRLVTSENHLSALCHITMSRLISQYRSNIDRLPSCMTNYGIIWKLGECKKVFYKRLGYPLKTC